MLKIIKKNFFLSISTFLILYFLFNLLDGERGLLSYLKKKQSLINLQNEELLLSNKINSHIYKPKLKHLNHEEIEQKLVIDLELTLDLELGLVIILELMNLKII